MVDTVYKRTRESAVPRYAGTRTLFRAEQDRRGRLYDEHRLSYAALAATTAVNAIFSSVGVALCCLIFPSPPICSRRGERPPLTYPRLFSLFPDVPRVFRRAQASLPSASLNLHLSPLSRFLPPLSRVLLAFVIMTVTRPGAGTEAVYRLRGFHQCVAIIVNCRRDAKERSPPS